MNENPLSTNDGSEADKRRRRRVVGGLYVAYAAFYLCRANFDASLPLLATEFGYDNESLGRLASLAILSYALGKVLLGPLGDFIGGRPLLAISMVGSVVATFGFGASGSLLAFTFFAGLNRCLQAGGWVGVVQLASHELPAEKRGSIMGVLSTSYEVGNVLSLIVCGALLGMGLGWRALFTVNPALFAVIAVVTLSVLTRAKRPPRRALDEAGARDNLHRAAGGAENDEPFGRRLAWLFGVPSFWIALALSFLLTFVRTGFATWIPMFLADLGRRHGGSDSGALVKSAIFPAAGFVGVLLAGRLSDRFGPGRRAPVIAGSLALLVAAILVLAHAGIDDPMTALLAIATSGLLLLGPYSLVGGAIVLDVGSTRAAGTAAGLIDAGGYLGASLSGFLVGTLAQRRGWSAAFDSLAGGALLACLVAAWWGVATTARATAQEAT